MLRAELASLQAGKEADAGTIARLERSKDLVTQQKEDLTKLLQSYRRESGGGSDKAGVE